MQGIVLAAGKGSRLQGKSRMNKCLLKVKNKTLLKYNLDLLARCPVSEIIIIVGYHSENIVQHIGYSYCGINVKYVFQKELLGVAHGVLCASPYINQDFFLCLSDEFLFSPNVESFLQFFNQSGADCTCGVVTDTVENVRKNYTVQLGRDNRILNLVEKPVNVYNNLKGTGYCAMRTTMIPLLESLQPNSIRGEYEMGDWIRQGIEEGLLCNAAVIALDEINVNTVEDKLRLHKYEEVQQ
jgi:dTDP-glucose pyrophosphorylase